MSTTMPNFEDGVKLNFPNLSKLEQYRISNYLAQSFEQGYHLGLNQGWGIEQDKDYADKEGGKA